MDAGLWKLRCAKCKTIFEIELSEADRITEFARNGKCPECLYVPASSEGGEPAFHEIVGFRAISKPK